VEIKGIREQKVNLNLAPRRPDFLACHRSKKQKDRQRVERSILLYFKIIFVATLRLVLTSVYFKSGYFFCFRKTLDSWKLEAETKSGVERQKSLAKN